MGRQANIFAMQHLQRDVRLLMAVTALMAVSFFGVQNLVKVLYVLRLGYGLEYVGLFNATGALTYMVMSLPGGAFGNRFGIRLAMRLGGVITVLGMALLPLTEGTTGWLRTVLPIVSQMVLVGGWALFGVNLVPALMGLTAPQARSQAYSLNSVFRGLGTFVGTVVGGFLPGLFVFLLDGDLNDPAPYRLSLWVAAVLGMVALWPLIKLGPIESRALGGVGEEAGPFPVGWVTLLIVYAFLVHGAFATCQAFCSAYMDTDLQLSPSAIGVISGVGQFVAMLTPLLVPGLLQRFNNRWMLVNTAFAMAASLLPLVFFHHWLAVGVGRTGMMAVDAMWQPSLQLAQMESVVARWRALAYGIIAMMLGLTFAIVGLGGGYLITVWGYRSLFLLGLGAAIVGGLVLRLVSAKSAVIAQEVN